MGHKWLRFNKLPTDTLHNLFLVCISNSLISRILHSTEHYYDMSVRRAQEKPLFQDFPSSILCGTLFIYESAFPKERNLSQQSFEIYQVMQTMSLKCDCHFFASIEWWKSASLSEIPNYHLSRQLWRFSDAGRSGQLCHPLGFGTLALEGYGLCRRQSFSWTNNLLANK